MADFNITDVVAETRDVARPKRRRSTRTALVTAEVAPTSIEVRKAAEALTIRNVSANEITFLQRKAYNAMLQVAQRGNTEQVTFEVSIKEFESLVGYNAANNRDYLKQLLRQLPSLQVEFDFRGNGKSKNSWGVAAMIAELYIIEDTSSIKFSFPPELKKRLLDPSIYNRIDLRMQNLFTSYSALALYEIVSRYFGAPLKKTFADDWESWSMLLSGANEPHKTFREFNKMMSRAIDQINAHEKRFFIQPHITKRSRKVDQLWFVIEELQQSELFLPSRPSLISEPVRKRLFGFGLSDDDINVLLVKHDEDYLAAHVEYTERRQNKKGVSPIGNVKAFFLKSIENNYADAPRRAPQNATPATKKETPKSPPRMGIDLLKDAWRHSRINEMRTSFYAQTEEKRLEIVLGIEDEIRCRGPIIWKQYQKRGYSAPLVEATVFEIIMKQHVTEPTTEELLQFAASSGKFG